MRQRVAVGVALLGLSVVSVACGGPSSVATRFDDARVEVRVSIEGTGSSRVVVAEFVPTQEHLHLYGLEMPDGGIDGAGRPTRLVVDDPNWRAVGALSTSVASTPVVLAGFDTPFPVYPDGPVTLRQPIEVVVDAYEVGPVAITVGFMACSSSGVCFAPVEAAPIAVPLDGGHGPGD